MGISYNLSSAGLEELTKKVNPKTIILRLYLHSVIQRSLAT